MNCPTVPEDHPLLDRVRLADRTRHLSPHTEQAYSHWIKRFMRYHELRPVTEMGEPEIARFLSSLATASHVSASRQNQALNALLFLYHEVLGKKIGLIQDVVRAKRAKRLLVVLTRKEVRCLLGGHRGVPWLMTMSLYGGRLRLMKCVWFPKGTKYGLKWVGSGLTKSCRTTREDLKSGDRYLAF